MHDNRQHAEPSSDYSLTGQVLLQLLNPKERFPLPLDNLVGFTQRHLVLKAPVGCRGEVKAALQNFIFERKTFSISREDLASVLNRIGVSQSAPAKESLVNEVKRNEIRRPSIEPPLLFNSPDSKGPPLPASIRKTIRNLSIERQFIAYGSDMNLTPFKPSPEKERRGSKRALGESHRRVTSVAVKENGKEEERTCSRLQSRKASLHKAILFDEPPLQQCHNLKRRASPARPHINTLESSFVGSSATTPKRGRMGTITGNSPTRRDTKVVVPSLKEGMEKLLREREMKSELAE